MPEEQNPEFSLSDTPQSMRERLLDAIGNLPIDRSEYVNDSFIGVDLARPGSDRIVMRSVDLGREDRDQPVQRFFLPAVEINVDSSRIREVLQQIGEQLIALTGEHIDDAFLSLGDRYRLADHDMSAGYAQKSDRPKACAGCCDYVGKSYGGNQIVCGIHPYGPQAESCEDWRDSSAIDWQEALRSDDWRRLDFSDTQIWLDRVVQLLRQEDYHVCLERIQIGMVQQGCISSTAFYRFVQREKANHA